MVLSFEWNWCEVRAVRGIDLVVVWSTNCISLNYETPSQYQPWQICEILKSTTLQKCVKSTDVKLCSKQFSHLHCFQIHESELQQSISACIEKKIKPSWLQVSTCRPTLNYGYAMAARLRSKSSLMNLFLAILCDRQTIQSVTLINALAVLSLARQVRRRVTRSVEVLPRLAECCHSPPPNLVHWKVTQESYCRWHRSLSETK